MKKVAVKFSIKYKKGIRDQVAVKFDDGLIVIADFPFYGFIKMAQELSVWIKEENAVEVPWKEMQRSAMAKARKQAAKYPIGLGGLRKIAEGKPYDKV